MYDMVVIVCQYIQIDRQTGDNMARIRGQLGRYQATGSTSKTKKIAVRLDDRIYDKLVHHSTVTGRSITDIVESALESMLNVTDESFESRLRRTWHTLACELLTGEEGDDVDNRVVALTEVYKRMFRIITPDFESWLSDVGRVADSDKRLVLSAKRGKNYQVNGKKVSAITYTE